MKVIQINATYGYASTGNIVKDIEDMLIAQKYEVGTVYQSAHRKVDHGYRIGNILDWKMHALASRFWGKQAYSSKLATKKMLRWLKKQKPDIVHLHNLHSNYINLNMLLKFLAEKDIATVITLHDCWFFTGKCFHYLQSNCEKWKTGCNHCPRNKLDVKSWFFDASRKVYADKKRLFESIPNLTVVACSDWMAIQSRQSLLKNRNILRIYNGIDIQLFKPHITTLRVKFGLENKFLIFGAANKWLDCENKRLFNRLLENMETNDRLVLFGCTSNEKMDLNSCEKIIALEYISDRDLMSDWFASVDVFANVTTADTLPTVNMEAAACGTPVVTFAVGGSPELVVPGKTGYIVDVGDDEGFIRAIGRVKNKAISRDDCRQFAVDNFDKTQNYIHYLKLYQDIVLGEENT